MDNYEVLEVIHSSKTSETIILKVKEKNNWIYLGEEIKDVNIILL